MKKIRTRVGAAVCTAAAAGAIIWGALALQPSAGSAAVASPALVSACAAPAGYSPAKTQAWQLAHDCRTAVVPAAQVAKSKAAAKARARGLAGVTVKVAKPASAGRIGTGAQLGGVPTPFSPAVTKISNMYLGLTPNGKEYLDVYAGVNLSKPSQGVLFISIGNAAGSTTVTAYPLPKAGGIASLVSHTATSIVVRDAAGGRFTFTIATATWS